MRHIISVYFIMILSCCLLAGCKKAEPADALVSENTVPRTLTLAVAEWGGAGADGVLLGTIQGSQRLVVDPLFYRDPDGNLTPNMAKSYSITEDGRTVTVELADDLRFYDGSPVTPIDVKRSLEWIKGQGSFSGDFNAVRSVKTDGNNVIFHLSRPSPKFLYNLGDSFFPVIKSEDIDSKSPEEILWGGTVYGAYYVNEYFSGSCATLKKNPYYKTYNRHLKNKGPSSIDTINVRFISDPFALVQGMLSGEIALTDRVTPNQLYELLMSPNIETKWAAEPNVVQLLLNNDFELFKDPDVRLALMLLIDRTKISAYSKGQYSPAYAFSVSGMSDYSSDAENYFTSNFCNQPEVALQLLSEKGWKDSDGDGYLDRNGKKFEFTVVFEDKNLNSLVEILQSEYKKNGIQMNIHSIDLATMSDLLKKDTYEAALNEFNWGDTAGILPYICPDVNILDSEVYNMMVEDAINTMDKNTRITGFYEVQKMLMDTRCNFPVVRINNLIVYNKMLLPHLVISNESDIFINDSN
ncbi:ABC transporter substrate-binding protein [Tissierella praeacuta]|uniref:ABC transporter substrate-binding protein n=1 Tax=Tissierella praeacuta TaxID=43131 RepID=UPI0033426850